ncbi:hypothetical protein O3M35_009858 [Rhynocoris fuscipes]|uniref:ATP synthase F0 subunit 8 n=1 Tax=Rhynocoris fuscipes TaxID=488301 RepID=A0AAW1D4I3_9HEMI
MCWPHQIFYFIINKSIFSQFILFHFIFIFFYFLQIIWHFHKSLKYSPLIYPTKRLL